MIDRYQGSTLTAGSDVIGAQIMDDPGLEAARQQRTVTQLNREPLFRAMQDSLAMETDYIDI